jgi:signal transduction histidine kinase
MPFAQWFRPPRRTLTVFLCLMAVLGSALGWLAWQVIERDRLVERSQVRDRLERAADHIAEALGRSLSDLDSWAAAGWPPAEGMLPDGAVVLRATAQSWAVRPESALLFAPAHSHSDEVVAGVFAEGEALEFRRDDPGAASARFRELSRSARADVRAGALARLGRTLRKTGRTDEALAVYGELAQLGATPALGLPAALAASEARCSVLEATGRTDELTREAARMATLLWSGRTALTRPVWQFHLDEARRWGADTAADGERRQALARSSAAEWLHHQWTGGLPSSGRRSLRFEGEPVVISWTAAEDRLAAAVAGRQYIQLIWSQAVRGQSVHGGLVDGDGQLAAGSGTGGGSDPRSARTPDATGLPWTVQVTSADPASDGAFFAGRRRLLLAGFTVLALVLVAGSYFITRSIARELAVTRLQSEFVATVSHEFRSPLTSIRQLTELLARGRVPTEELKQQSYDILSHESGRLQRLIESLLDFGRIEAGAMQYRFERLDAAALVDEVVAGFQESAAAQGFQIEVSRTDAPAWVLADREALGLAVRNLIDNAIKYSPECRTVWVEAVLRDRHLAVSVRDRGAGIPLGEQRAIFDRFVRGSGSRETGIKGTGIGLTLARHVVRAHGGEIRLESVPGQGSTFTILLSLEDAE